MHLFCRHPYNNIIFTSMLCRVDITGVSDDQNLCLEDDNYASIALSAREVNPNFASFEGNPFPAFPDPIERCVQYIYIYIYIYGRKKQINYKFIPTSLFRGRPLISDEWATTKQACRDELVVYLFFSPIYILLYFHVLSTVLRTSSLHFIYIYIYIYIYLACSNFYSL